MTRGRIIAILIVVAALAGAGYFGGYKYGRQLLNSGKSAASQRVPLAAPAPTPVQMTEGDATPLAERVATLALLNKRNGEIRDLEMKPGESRRIGNAIVRLSACERTAPWEQVPETGAFVQLLVQERETRSSEPVWKRVFSGWVFKESPSLNVVEHPIYDVWVKNCAMEYPGEDAPVEEAGKGAPSAAPTASAPANAENPATSPDSAPRPASGPATPATDTE
ncbi:hypothetical protein C7451_10472 [Blastomonas natatoria]|uniref:DUF2155 domain-containing protein n=1 Tax=Blastomonas natatoria TaxID=34015 RepID=A0A2V3VA10_9SPHN|nr:hypothetical protein C7451_10472 [Blastomonas natatoria]